MNSSIFKKEIWIYVLFCAVAVILLVIFLPLKTGVKKGDFMVVLDYGNGAEKRFTGNLDWSISAWDVLQQANANLLIKLEAAPDFYPKTIDSWENGHAGKKWVLYLNGEKVSGSPIDVNINKDDALLWRFE